MAPLIIDYKTSWTILFFPFVIAILSTTAAFTEEERIAIGKFRPMVLDVLTQDYQKDDSYLVRWLRAKELDLDAAAEMLQKAQKWRKENKIDTILEESNLFDEPGTNNIVEYTDGFDKQGTPLMTFNYGQADIRRLILEGKEKYFRRSIIYMWEKFGLIARESSNRTGSEESQVVIITDFAGYNRKQHMCVPCIQFVWEWTQLIENFYPGLCKLHVLVNVPRGYDFIAERSKATQSAHTIKTTKIFGLDKAEWSAFLDKYIAPDQRSFQFGGSKVKKV